MLVQHTFLYISLPLFCTTTTWNVQKLPSYTFYGGKVVRVPVHLFIAAAYFHLGGRLHFSFSHRRDKIFMFFFLLLPCFFIPRSSSFSVIHVSVDIKIESKERTSFVVLSSLKVRVAKRFTAETCGCLTCKISPRLTWRGGRMFVQTIFSEPKFPWYIDNQMFLPMVLPCAKRARNEYLNQIGSEN